MKKPLLAMASILTSIGSLNAATNLVFNNLNSDVTTGNSLNVGGSNTGVSVTGAATGLGYTYSISFTGADFDGDSTNDTLTFDVIVSGWSGSIDTFGTSGDNSNSSVVLGTTETQVALNNTNSAPNSFNPFSAGRFDDGETLQFSLTSFDVVLSSGALASAASTGFTGVLLDELTGTNHQSIFGEGTGLDGDTFNANVNKSLPSNFGTGDLFITASGGSGNNNRTYSATNVDFGIEVNLVAIPEPSTSLLVALSGFSLILRRRR